MQPDSQQSPPAVITADGKCESVSESTRLGARNGTLEVIEVIIDGRRMAGGTDSPTLTGKPGGFLPATLHFTLSHFDPLPDGRCLARYVRCRAEDSPDKEPC